jgi:hypothetical protein
MNERKGILVFFVGIVAIFLVYWIFSNGVVSVFDSFYATRNNAAIHISDGSAGAASNGEVAGFVLDGGQATGTAGSLNATQKVEQSMLSIFGTFMNSANPQSGAPLSTSTLEQLALKNGSQLNIDSLQNSSAINLASPIPPGDIRTISDNSSAALKTYSDQYFKITSRIAPTLSSPTTFENALLAAATNGDQSQIGPTIDLLNSMYKDLAATPVPSKVVSLHEETLAVFRNFAEVLSVIANAQNDPLRAYWAASNSFPAVMEELKQVASDSAHLLP